MPERGWPGRDRELARARRASLRRRREAPTPGLGCGKTLAEAEAFALGEYASALLQGDRLPPERRREIAGKVARFTGLSPEWVLRANLRVEHERLCKELLRDRGKDPRTATPTAATQVGNWP